MGTTKPSVHLLSKRKLLICFLENVVLQEKNQAVEQVSFYKNEG